jgi:phosphoribosylanthranilate isomerase
MALIAKSDNDYTTTRFTNMADEIKMTVCGMREGNNILEVSLLQPHYMGFIFYSRSPRYVGDDFRIPEDFPAATKKVGVFVDETTDEILKKVDACRLDFVQLHGNEMAEQCADIKRRGIGVIKVLSVDDETDFRQTEIYRDVVDYFLFDTKGKYYGGNAATFDWNILSRYDQKVPFFLSGGITPAHIGEIKKLKDYNLLAIDVNSGVEIRTAFKDPGKIKAIMTKLKSKQ